jgi:tellurite resistance protein TerA
MDNVSLAKVSLDKKGASVSLEKRDGGFGDVRVNLNWNQGGDAPAPTGFFGKLFGAAPRQSAPSVDLDLGCLYEMVDGNKGAVQALGGNMGRYDGFPYIQLSGDDRTGQNADGETIRINGAKFAQIKRLLFYTFIYDGAPNWAATDGVVTVNVPGERPIEVRLNEGGDDRIMCGICLIENVGGRMKVSREVAYYASHSELDRAHRWGMRWKVGTKD